MRPFVLPVLAALLSAAPALTLSTSSPVAYVYVGSPTRGIYVYHAAPNGQLTLVSGSPFQTVGQGVGSTGSYFFNAGTYKIHVYPVAANGALKPQISEIDTRSYTGANCGSTVGVDSILDHSGQDLYVFLNNLGAADQCIAYQSFKIDKTAGTLSYIGTATRPVWYGYQTIPSMNGSNMYLFAGNEFDTNISLVNAYGAYRHETTGSLALWDITVQFPPLDGGNLWGPYLIEADPTNHVAVAMDRYGGTKIYLASFTADAQGNLTTTNTSATMPLTDVFPTALNMSPDGKYLALAGSFNQSAFHGTAGLEVYYFNGAAPLKKYKVLTTVPVDQIHWDKSNHLYAVSDSTSQVFVFTVASVSITEAPGSPYKVPAPTLDSLTVVPK